MLEWTLEQVAERFREAAETAHRLPSARVQGYFNLWSGFPRETWQRYPDDEKVYRFPPTPEAIDRWEEVTRWALWLTVEERHLVWMRAEDWDWKDIARRFGCERTTAWRRWRKALSRVAEHLNGVEDAFFASA
jgi:DNA-directed RNA polymerase specialized sigma24 family protein